MIAAASVGRAGLTRHPGVRSGVLAATLLFGCDKRDAPYAPSVLPSGLVPGRLGDVLVNTRHASLGALEIEGDVAKAVLGLEPDLVDLPVDAALGAVFEGTYSGDREGTRYVVSHRDSSLWREGAAGDAPMKLLRQDSVTFGRDDWPFDRLVFEVHGGQAGSFSVYYNGFFDGRYQRVAAEGAFR